MLERLHHLVLHEFIYRNQVVVSQQEEHLAWCNGKPGRSQRSRNGPLALICTRNRYDSLISAWSGPVVLVLALQGLNDLLQILPAKSLSHCCTSPRVKCPSASVSYSISLILNLSGQRRLCSSSTRVLLHTLRSAPCCRKKIPEKLNGDSSRLFSFRTCTTAAPCTVCVPNENAVPVQKGVPANLLELRMTDSVLLRAIVL